MIYGSAMLMDIPWELIIKKYRRDLSTNSFPKLVDYSKNFLSSVEKYFTIKSHPIISNEDQARWRKLYMTEVLNNINGEILEVVKKEIAIDSPTPDEKIREIRIKIIHKNFDKWQKFDNLEHISENTINNIFKTHETEIETIIKEVFDKQDLTDDEIIKLKTIASSLLYKDIFDQGIIPYSGIVIAGYGENEILPSIENYLVLNLVSNRLINRKDKTGCRNLSFLSDAGIVPFAQSDMTGLFALGIDSNFYFNIGGFLNHALTKRMPEDVVSQFKLEDNDQNEKLKDFVRSTIQQSGEKILQEVLEKISSNQYEKFLKPLLESISILPRDELAAFAESLVNLTALKRRVTRNQQETVGGPIDVAVISKSDGFIWIKRKHYFKPEFNHHFFDNYYREEKPKPRRRSNENKTK